MAYCNPRFPLERYSATLALTFDNGETIETTSEHPFYIVGRGFVKAGELGIGSSLNTLLCKSNSMKRTSLFLALGIAGWSGCAAPPDEALDTAIRADEPEAVKAAIERGAKFNELIEPKEKFSLGLSEIGKTSALMNAVVGGDTAAVKTLLEAGADPNLNNENGLSPLYLSLPSQNRNSNVVKMLLEAGADPNVIYQPPERKPAQTPLMRALETPNRPSEVELLLKHGARPKLITPDGKSAMDVFDLQHYRKGAAANQGLKLLQRRGFKIRLVPPTDKQIEDEQYTQKLEKSGRIVRPY